MQMRIKLKERMAAERAAMLERNLKKAEEAAEKVQHAADLRLELTAQQRVAYLRRTAAQQSRHRARRH